MARTLGGGALFQLRFLAQGAQAIVAAGKKLKQFANEAGGEKKLTMVVGVKGVKKAVRDTERMSKQLKANAAKALTGVRRDADKTLRSVSKSIDGVTGVAGAAAVVGGPRTSRTTRRLAKQAKARRAETRLATSDPLFASSYAYDVARVQARPERAPARARAIAQVARLGKLRKIVERRLFGDQSPLAQIYAQAIGTSESGAISEKQLAAALRSKVKGDKRYMDQLRSDISRITAVPAGKRTLTQARDLDRLRKRLNEQVSGLPLLTKVERDLKYVQREYGSDLGLSKSFFSNVVGRVRQLRTSPTLTNLQRLFYDPEKQNRLRLQQIAAERRGGRVPPSGLLVAASAGPLDQLDQAVKAYQAKLFQDPAVIRELERQAKADAEDLKRERRKIGQEQRKSKVGALAPREPVIFRAKRALGLVPTPVTEEFTTPTKGGTSPAAAATAAAATAGATVGSIAGTKYSKKTQGIIERVLRKRAEPKGPAKPFRPLTDEEVARYAVRSAKVEPKKPPKFRFGRTDINTQASLFGALQNIGVLTYGTRFEGMGFRDILTSVLGGPHITPQVRARSLRAGLVGRANAPDPHLGIEGSLIPPDELLRVDSSARRVDALLRKRRVYRADRGTSFFKEFFKDIATFGVLGGDTLDDKYRRATVDYGYHYEDLKRRGKLSPADKMEFLSRQFRIASADWSEGANRKRPNLEYLSHQEKIMDDLLAEMDALRPKLTPRPRSKFLSKGARAPSLLAPSLFGGLANIGALTFGTRFQGLGLRDIINVLSGRPTGGFPTPKYTGFGKGALAGLPYSVAGLFGSKFGKGAGGFLERFSDAFSNLQVGGVYRPGKNLGGLPFDQLTDFIIGTQAGRTSATDVEKLLLSSRAAVRKRIGTLAKKAKPSKEDTSNLATLRTAETQIQGLLTELGAEGARLASFRYRDFIKQQVARGRGAAARGVAALRGRSVFTGATPGYTGFAKSQLAGGLGDLSLTGLYRRKFGLGFGRAGFGGESFGKDITATFSTLQDAGVYRPGRKIGGLQFDQLTDYLVGAQAGQVSAGSFERLLLSSRAAVRSRISAFGKKKKLSAADKSQLKDLRKAEGQIEGLMTSLVGESTRIATTSWGSAVGQALKDVGYAAKTGIIGRLRAIGGSIADSRFAQRISSRARQRAAPGAEDLGFAPAVFAPFGKVGERFAGDRIRGLSIAQLLAGKGKTAFGGTKTATRLRSLSSLLGDTGILRPGGKFAGLQFDQSTDFLAAAFEGKVSVGDLENFLQTARARARQKIGGYRKRGVTDQNRDAVNALFDVERQSSALLATLASAGEFDTRVSPAARKRLAAARRSRAARRAAAEEKGGYIQAERERIAIDKEIRRIRAAKRAGTATDQDLIDERAYKAAVKGAPKGAVAVPKRSTKAGGTGPSFFPKEGGNRFRSFYGALQSVAQFAGASAIIFTIANAFRQAAAAGVSFEAAMAGIQGVLPTRSLGERLEIEKSVTESARQYALQLDLAAESARIFAQQGLRAGEVGRQVEATLAAARGLGISPDVAREGLTAVRKISEIRSETASVQELAFGRQVQSLEILDRISRVESRRAITAQDILEAIKASAPLARQLRGDLVGVVDEFDLVTGAVTTIVEQTRVTGKTAATSLRFILARLGRPQVLEQIEQIGKVKLATAESGGRQLLPLIQILDELSEAYNRLKTEQGTASAARFLVAVAGARQINAAAALLGNYQSTLETARLSANAFGDTQQRVNIQMDTFQAKSQKLGVELAVMGKGFVQNSGTALLLRTALDGVTSALRATGSAGEYAEIKLLGLLGALSLLLYLSSFVKTTIAGIFASIAGLAGGGVLGGALAVAAALLATVGAAALIGKLLKDATVKTRYEIDYYDLEDLVSQKLPKLEQFINLVTKQGEGQLGNNLTIGAEEAFKRLREISANVLREVTDQTITAMEAANAFTTDGERALTQQEKIAQARANDFRYFRREIAGADDTIRRLFFEQIEGDPFLSPIIDNLDTMTEGLSEVDAQIYKTQAAMTLLGDALAAQQGVLEANFNLFKSLLEGIREEIKETSDLSLDVRSKLSRPISSVIAGSSTVRLAAAGELKGKVPDLTAATGPVILNLAQLNAQYADGISEAEKFAAGNDHLSAIFQQFGKSIDNVRLGNFLSDILATGDATKIFGNALAELVREKDGLVSTLDVLDKVGTTIQDILAVGGKPKEDLVGAVANRLETVLAQGGDPLRVFGVGDIFGSQADPFANFQQGLISLLDAARAKLEQVYLQQGKDIKELVYLWERARDRVKTLTSTIKKGLANIHDPFRELLTDFYNTENAITANQRAAIALGLAYDETGERLKNIQKLGQSAFGIQEEFVKRTLAAVVQLQDQVVAASDINEIAGVTDLLAAGEYKALGVTNTLDFDKAVSGGATLTLAKQKAIVIGLLDRLKAYRDNQANILDLFDLGDIVEGKQLMQAFTSSFDELNKAAGEGDVTLKDGVLTLQQFLRIVTYLNQKRLQDIIPRRSALQRLREVNELFKTQTEAIESIAKQRISGGLDVVTFGLRNYEKLTAQVKEQVALSRLAVSLAQKEFENTARDLDARQRIGDISKEDQISKLIEARTTLNLAIAQAEITEEREKQLLLTKLQQDEDKRVAELTQQQYEARIAGLKEVLTNYETLKKDPLGGLLGPAGESFLKRQVDILLEGLFDPTRGIAAGVGKIIGLTGELDRKPAIAIAIETAMGTGSSAVAQQLQTSFLDGSYVVRDQFYTSLVDGGTEAARLIKLAIEDALRPITGGTLVSQRQATKALSAGEVTQSVIASPTYKAFAALGPLAASGYLSAEVERRLAENAAQIAQEKAAANRLTLPTPRIQRLLDQPLKLRGSDFSDLDLVATGGATNSNALSLALQEIILSGAATGGVLGGSLLGGGGRGAQIGSKFGSGAGTAIGTALGGFGGPIGAALGGVAGGIIGGLFDNDDKQTRALEVIARESAEQVRLLENTNKLLDLQKVSFNLPTGFTLPAFTPSNLSGGSGSVPTLVATGAGGTNVSVSVGDIYVSASGGSDPRAIAATVREALVDELRASGLSVSR